MAVLFKGKILNDDEINYLTNFPNNKNFKPFKWYDWIDDDKQKTLMIGIDPRQESKQYKLIKNTINEKINELTNKSSLNGHSDRLIKYEKGCLINRHHDVNTFASAITIIHLSDDLEGGELYVNDEVVKLEIGETIIMEKDYHEVKKVTNGTRIVHGIWYS